MTAKRHAGPLRSIAEAAGVLLSRHNLLVSFIASQKKFALISVNTAASFEDKQNRGIVGFEVKG